MEQETKPQTYRGTTVGSVKYAR